MPAVLTGKKRNNDMYKKCQDFNNNPSYEGFVNLIKDNPLYDNRRFCRICGGELYYSNVRFRGAYQQYPKIYQGTSPLSKKVINGVEYNICVCEKCMSEHFKEWNDIKNKSRVFNRPTQYAQYAYNIPEDVIYDKNNELCIRSLESFIKKYGDDEGKKRWDVYLEKQRITNTFEYKHEKYGMSEDEFDAYNKSRSSTLENFVKRHGEEDGLRLWEEYRKREAYCNTRKYFIETYGDVDGLKKWKNFDDSRKNIGCYSQISQELFNKLIDNDIFKGHEIYFADHNYEYEVLSNSGHLYYLDFYDKTINLCTEFNGVKFHPKPGKYNNDDVFEGLYNYSGKTVGELIERDNIRNEHIHKTIGAKIIVVWEDDYKHNKRSTLNKLLSDIKKYIENGNI